MSNEFRWKKRTFNDLELAEQQLETAFLKQSLL